MRSTRAAGWRRTTPPAVANGVYACSVTGRGEIVLDVAGVEVADVDVVDVGFADVDVVDVGLIDDVEVVLVDVADAVVVDVLLELGVARISTAWSLAAPEHPATSDASRARLASRPRIRSTVLNLGPLFSAGPGPLN